MSLLSSITGFFGYSNARTNQVTIEVAGRVISGWTSLSIRRGIEIMPSTFELECTEYFPKSSEVLIPEGESCIIRIGDQKIITGYIVTVNRRLGYGTHVVSVQGNSKSIDLCECSAKFETYQFNNRPVVDLIRTICSPYGIDVKTVGDIDNVVLPQFSVILTETGYEIIERMTRAAALLFYDDADGNIILSKVGSRVVSSGFVEGKNVEEAVVRRSMAGRFSNVTMILQNTSSLFSAPGDNSQLAAQFENITTGKPATDPGVKRYRPMLISAEMGDMGYVVSQQRAQWEVNRRFGRSQSIQVVTDSWRDQQGKLWEPNTLVPVSFPTLKVNTKNHLLIAEVVFRLDMGGGTHAEITLMPKEAFSPQPIVLNAANSAVVQAMSGR